MKLIHKTISGQSLIEIVVAVGIISLVLVGVSDLVVRSLKLSRFQADKNVAVNIAQNQLNYYRQVRDQEPTLFFQIPNPVEGYSNCVGTFDSAKYTCQISYSGITNGVEMSVSVTWNDGNSDISTSLSQTLAKPSK